MVVSSWIQIALDRDMIGDFARGIGRLPFILYQIDRGVLDRTLCIQSETITAISACVSAPSRHWPDQVGIHAAQEAVSLAQDHSIGLVAFPKPSIVGAVLKPVVSAGFLGIVLVQNTPRLNGRISVDNCVGNNPIAICAPGDPPFLFDGALSQFSFFDLLDKAQKGESIPEGAILDENGCPSLDPDVVVRLAEEQSGVGSLVPLGGIKGLGLAMGVECLAGALTGGFYDPPSGKPWGQGALVIVLSPHLFGVENLESQMVSYLSNFASYPGQHASQMRNTVRNTGYISYPETVVQTLSELAGKHDIELGFSES